MKQLIFQSSINTSQQLLWDWHQRTGALERLIPPFESAKVISRDRSVDNRVLIEVGLGPIKINWEGEVTDINEPNYFVDEIIKGPFPYWKHVHSFNKLESNSQLVDEINYKLPGGFLGRIFLNSFIKSKLKKQFDWRHKRLINDVDAFNAHPKRQKIIVSGASGLVGTELILFLVASGHRVIQVLRKEAEVLNGVESITWSELEKEKSEIENARAWVHLGGDNISEGKWTKAKKERILNSRINSTTKVGQAISSLKNPPSVWVNASAMGIYGTHGDFDETSPAGEDFLAQVCAKWEAAAVTHCPEEVKLVIPRIGVVLSNKGAALKKIKAIHQWCLGGPIGDGKRIMSWIDVDDLTYIIWEAINNPKYYGAFNAVTENPTTSTFFTKELDKQIKRFNKIPIPPFVLKMLYGEMADATVLSSAVIRPNKLRKWGYRFRFNTLKESFKNQLG